MGLYSILEKYASPQIGKMCLNGIQREDLTVFLFSLAPQLLNHVS